MDRKWFVSNPIRLLLWSHIWGSLLVSSYKIPGFLADNVINDGHFLTNDLIQGNENDGGTIINGVVNDDKHGDYDSKEQNGDDKLIRSHENELPLEPRSRGRKRCNVLLLEHLSNLTEIDRGPGNQTVREIFINSEDSIKLYDENEDEEEYEEDETGFETSLQKAEPRTIFHLNLLNPHNFISEALSENHSKELVRTKRQAQGGRRRRRCRCGRRRRVRRRRRRRRRGRTGAQGSSGRRRGGRRRRRGGRRRCVCRGRGAGGGGGGGGGGGDEGEGGSEDGGGEAEGGGEEEGGGGDEAEGGGEEEGGGGDEAEEGGEEEGDGGDEGEGEEEEEGSPETSGEDEKSDEKSSESNRSSDESDEKEGD